MNDLPKKMLKVTFGYGDSLLMPVEVAPFVGEFVKVAECYVDPSPSVANYEKYQHIESGEVCQFAIVDTSTIEPCKRPEKPKPVDPPKQAPMTVLPLTNDEQTVSSDDVPELRSFVDEHRDEEPEIF